MVDFPVSAEPRKFQVSEILPVARSTKLIRFKPIDGRPLEPSEAGAHVSIILPNGMERQYSLIEPSDAPTSYLVGVKRDVQSRGGSSFIVDELQVGDQVEVRPPRNHFPLVEDAGRSLLLAGGIGITPIWSMAQRLTAIGRPWKLAYTCLTPGDALFLDDLQGDPRVQMHFNEVSGSFLDITALCADEPDNTHFYCCGPTPMLAAFKDATQDRQPDQVHFEAFTPTVAPALEGGFTVELARSGKTAFIKPGETILEAVTALGIDAPSSCLLGVCGACETAIVSGIPDHRDSVLSDKEREAGKTMMICCSGALSAKLVLDL